MRLCYSCRREDRAQLDYTEECSCKAGSKDPAEHKTECRALVHEVALYPAQIAQRELIPDQSGVFHLPPRYAGWKLIQRGPRWYRAKYLCRDCIEREERAQAFKRDYERVCKAARGESDLTYAQMLAQQSVQ